MRTVLISLLAISFLFSACQTPEQKKEKLKQAALKKKAKADLRQGTDVDFQAFVERLRKAAAKRDTETLKSMMTENFGYNLEKGWDGIEPKNGGPGVFAYWEQENLWPELDGILSERFVKKGAFWVSPPQFADPSLNYDGYRAGVTRVRGSWKFAYFVNG
jgi:phytoene dehydrogenase-like protein